MTGVIKLSQVMAQLIVCSSLVWMVGEFKVSTGINFSLSTSLSEASRARASASVFCNLKIWLIVYELKDPNNSLAF